MKQDQLAQMPRTILTTQRGSQTIDREKKNFESLGDEKACKKLSHEHWTVQFGDNSLKIERLMVVLSFKECFLALTSFKALPEVDLICWLQSKNKFSLVSLIKSIRVVALLCKEKALYKTVLLIVVQLQAAAFSQLLSYSTWVKMNQFWNLNHCFNICQEQRNGKRERFQTSSLKKYHVLNEIFSLCLSYHVTKETINKRWEERSADSITILLEKPSPEYEIPPIMVTTVSCSLWQS